MVKYNDLIRGMKKVTPSSPRFPMFRVRQSGNPIYYAGTKMIRFMAQVGSDTINTKKGPMSTYRRPNYYNVEIDFKNVEPTMGLSPIEIQKKVTPRPSLSKSDIMVRCNCINNRFRIDFANRRAKAAAGSRPPTYHRIYPGPHINDDTPAICKHAICYVEWLLKNGFITE